MIVEVIDNTIKCSYPIIIKETKLFSNIKLPLDVKFEVWKEEVYFSIPADFEPTSLEYRIRPGYVYYWPPGRALCLFYGVSEAYTPVSPVGKIIGPLSNIKYINSGDEGIVNLYKEKDRYKEVLEIIRKYGYESAIALSDESEIIVASKVVNGVRLAFNVFIEEYGYHLESEHIFKYDGTIPSLRFMFKLKGLVQDNSKVLRFDLSEDGFGVITAGVYDLNELEMAIRELEPLYIEIDREVKFKL